jgi:hypothetical protein
MRIGEVSHLNLLYKQFTKVEKSSSTSNNGNGSNQHQKRQQSLVYKNPKDEYAKGQLINLVG